MLSDRPEIITIMTIFVVQLAHRGHKAHRVHRVSQDAQAQWVHRGHQAFKDHKGQRETLDCKGPREILDARGFKVYQGLWVQLALKETKVCRVLLVQEVFKVREAVMEKMAYKVHKVFKVQLGLRDPPVPQERTERMEKMAFRVVLDPRDLRVFKVLRDYKETADCKVPLEKMA